MLDACYRRWYLALAEMPTWGEALDRQVLQFAAVCRDLALGNLHWRFVCLSSFCLLANEFVNGVYLGVGLCVAAKGCFAFFAFLTRLV